MSMARPTLLFDSMREPTRLAHFGQGWPARPHHAYSALAHLSGEDFHGR